VTRGYDVVPVNPRAREIEGRPCFGRLQDVQPPVDAVLLMVGPACAEKAARDAVEIGVKHVWFHRGTGQGASTPAALAACAEAGVEVVDGLCPFMALPGASWIHRVHGFFRRRALAR
jgi:predicted CoA-binding protein